MLTVDDYAKIRVARRDNMSIREIARTFGHSRRKVREILANPQPKSYTRNKPKAAPVLGWLHAVIDRILSDDEDAPPKQRHTAMQLFRRLCDEYAYKGGYAQVRRYVRAHRLDHRETFIPLYHGHPGHSRFLERILYVPGHARSCRSCARSCGPPRSSGDGSFNGLLCAEMENWTRFTQSRVSDRLLRSLFRAGASRMRATMQSGPLVEAQDNPFGWDACVAVCAFSATGHRVRISKHPTQEIERVESED